MTNKSTSLKKHFAFYAAGEEHRQSLTELEDLLGLNVHFKARRELAERVLSGLSFSRDLKDELTPKREKFQSSIESALDPEEGNVMQKLYFRTSNPVSGKLDKFPIAACLLQPTANLREGQASYVHALFINAVIFIPQNDYSNIANHIRLFFAEMNMSRDVIRAIPETFKTRVYCQQTLNSLLNIDKNILGHRAKNFINAICSLLRDVRGINSHQSFNPDNTVPNVASVPAQLDIEGNVPVLQQLTVDNTPETVGNLPVANESKLSEEHRGRDSSRWITENQLLTPGDYRRLLFTERKHLTNSLIEGLASNIPKTRSVAALLMLIYITGQERDTVLQFTFGEDGDITPDGRYRREVKIPEDGSVPANEVVEKIQHADFLYLPLPKVLKDWKSDIKSQNRKLIECLGLSEEEARDGIKSLLIDIRKEPIHYRIRLEKIQAALAIELTLLFRDESLTHMIAGRPQHAPPALSYYLAHDTSKLQDSYRTTLGSLLADYTEEPITDGMIPTFDPDSVKMVTGYYPTDASIILLRNNAEDALERAKKTANIFEIHNAYTDYCLLVLFFATGHRPVMDPFPKYSHFDLERNMMVISDKVSSQERPWRLVALPPIAAKQIEYYYQYLNALPTKLFIQSEYQDLGARLAHSIFSAENTLPFFFYLDPNAKDAIESISRSSMTKRWNSLWHWPIDFPRHIMANELLQRSGSGELVKIQLGHNYSNEHQFGMRSAMPPLTTLNTISKHIDNSLGYFGWSPLKSPIRKSTPIYETKKENHWPSRQLGYEVRNKHRNDTVEAAKKIIRNLSQRIFNTTRLNHLSLKNIAQLLEEISAERELSNPQRSKCVSVLLRYAKFLSRKQAGKQVSHFIYRDIEVSPFSESSIRDYQTSFDIRSRWFIYLNRQKVSKHIDIDRRYAEIIISAALCGGLLNEVLLENLHSALAEVLFVLGESVFVDFSEYKNTKKTRNRWYPDDVTRALILGLVNHSKGELKSPDGRRFKSIFFEILSEIEIDNSLPFKALVDAGKSLALIEVPGFLRAYATGETPAVSLPLIRLVRLHNDKALVDHDLNATQEFNATDNSHHYWLPELNKNSSGKSIGVFKKLFQQHLKAIEQLPSDGTFTKDHKLKNALVRLLTEDFADPSSWDPLCSLAAGFTISLCREGTIRKEDSAYNTVRDYSGYVFRFLSKLSDDINLFAIDEEWWEEIYTEGVFDTTPKERGKACNILKQFHIFLTEKYGFDELDWSPIYAAAGCQSESANIDANCISEQEYLDLLALILNSDAIRSHLRDQLALIVLLGYRGGLRISEAHGMLTRDFQISDVIDIIVKANLNRPLKSDSGLRCITLDDVNELELALIKRCVLSLKFDIDHDRLTSVMHCHTGEGREIIDRGFATRIIHTHLRAMTGDSSLRYHHLRHSKVSHSVRKSQHPIWAKRKFATSTEFNISLHPLHHISKSIGHADVITTLISYTHCLDELLCQWLPNMECSLNDYGRAYCLGLAYDSIRKKRLLGYEQLLSIKNNKRAVTLIQKPKYQVRSRDLGIQKHPITHSNETLTLVEVEDLLLRYTYSPMGVSEFAELTGTDLKNLEHVIAIALQVERTSGFTRYALTRSAGSYPFSSPGIKKTVVKFSVAENKRVRREIIAITNTFLPALPDLTKIKYVLELWCRTFHAGNGSNILITNSELKQLSDLIFQLFGEVDMVLRFESKEHEKQWQPAISGNITIDYKPIPKAHEKLRNLQTMCAELIIQGNSERWFICRALFVLCVYFCISEPRGEE